MKKYAQIFEAYKLNEATTSTRELLSWVKDAEGKKVIMTVKERGEGTTKNIEKLQAVNKNGLWEHGDLYIDFKDEFTNKNFILLLMTKNSLNYLIEGGWEIKLEK